MPTQLPLFVLTTWLLAMLPGAGQAMMMRQTLEGGLGVARATIVGNAVGLLLWSLSAAAGLSTLLLTNPGVYTVVRIAGGVVLVVLGINTLRAGRAGPTPPGRDGPRGGSWGAFGTGLATNLGNPKAGVFAVSVLPQFVTAHGPAFASIALLGAVWAFVNACWYLLFTWGVSRGRALMTRPAVQRGLRVVTGLVLLALGTAVAAGV
ncbi:MULTISPECIES: LysE family translocator [unclassified Streptomyces]|uniref:LysE family translocator n=1 Tax=unclassified Streptomyces TaxID=2593676 RepID=UPI000AF0243F|nr:LysE family translocator [Streptomyces polychromogenes]